MLSAFLQTAGYKAVGESVALPQKYYANNIQSTVAVANACIEHSCNKFVFLSSATVYGDNDIPFVETMALKPTTNPYGETKAINERILKDTAKALRELGWRAKRTIENCCRDPWILEVKATD